VQSHLFSTIMTWASVFPFGAIGESGWNNSCILGKLPYVCGESYDTYLFVRQTHDIMCHPDSLPLYNFHQCIGPVDAVMVRSTDVLMGVSNPLYRRAMFGPDFLDIAKYVARKKVRRLLAKDAAIRETLAGENLANTPRGGKENDLLTDEVRALAQEALAHPDLADLPVFAMLDRNPPPEQVFLVDDVYTSAYLTKVGVPKFIVPATMASVFPPGIERMPNRHYEIPAVVGANDAEPQMGRGDLSAKDALHGQPLFDLANHRAVRYFHSIGWW
jgi:hypothetical protein